MHNALWWALIILGSFLLLVYFLVEELADPTMYP